MLQKYDSRSADLNFLSKERFLHNIRREFLNAMMKFRDPALYVGLMRFRMELQEREDTFYQENDLTVTNTFILSECSDFLTVQDNRHWKHRGGYELDSQLACYDRYAAPSLLLDRLTVIKYWYLQAKINGSERYQRKLQTSNILEAIEHEREYLLSLQIPTHPPCYLNQIELVSMLQNAKNVLRIQSTLERVKSADHDSLTEGDLQFLIESAKDFFNSDDYHVLFEADNIRNLLLRVERNIVEANKSAEIYFHGKHVNYIRLISDLEKSHRRLEYYFEKWLVIQERHADLLQSPSEALSQWTQCDLHDDVVVSGQSYHVERCRTDPDADPRENKSLDPVFKFTKSEEDPDQVSLGIMLRRKQFFCCLSEENIQENKERNEAYWAVIARLKKVGVYDRLCTPIYHTEFFEKENNLSPRFEFMQEADQDATLLQWFESMRKLYQNNEEEIKRIYDIQVFDFIHQIATILFTLHSLKIAWTDLKITNIFLANGVVKLSDLKGLKDIIDSVMGKMNVYTSSVMSPQILRYGSNSDSSSNDDAPYTRKNVNLKEVGIFSLGVAAYSLIVGEPVRDRPQDVDLADGYHDVNLEGRPHAKFLFPRILRILSPKRTIDYPLGKFLKELEIYALKNQIELTCTRLLDEPAHIEHFDLDASKMLKRQKQKSVEPHPSLMH